MTRRIAFLTAAEGIERVELTEPWEAVTGAGHTAELLSLEAGEVQVFDHLDRAETRPAWTLVEADAVRGRRLASWPSLQTDIRNAGGEWVDEEVVEDGNLITSRNPGDLPAFTKALLAALD